MRVGLVIYGSLDTGSGGYLYDRKLVEGLRRCGDQVEIVSIPWRNYPAHLGDNVSEDLYHRLLDLPVDVLLEDELNHPSLFLLNRRLSSHQDFPPILAIVHHLRSSERRSAWLNRLYSWIETRFLASVDGFLVNSQATLRVVRKHLRRERPIQMVYPGRQEFDRLPTQDHILERAGQPGPLKVIFLGNLIPRKGLHRLLTAVAGLPIECCQVSVVGDPEIDPGYARRMRALADQPSLVGRVVFHGRLPDAGLANLLAGQHILAVPSDYEGFGIAYLDGMAFGLPALATPRGGASELVEPGRTGFLVDPENSAEIGQALQVLWKDRGLLARMSLAARDRYQHHPTWEDSALAMRAFIQRIPKNR